MYFVLGGTIAMARHISSTEHYAGQYVAFRSRDDDTVVAAGPNLAEVMRQAKLAGVERPLVARVPERDSVMIY
jgi:hypothetical protein